MTNKTEHKLRVLPRSERVLKSDIELPDGAILIEPGRVRVGAGAYHESELAAATDIADRMLARQIVASAKR